MLENPMVSGYGFNRGGTGRLFFKMENEPSFDTEEEELELVECAECGKELIKEESHESYLWEDTFICECKECIDGHYTGAYENI